ncbi:hypothetical protein ACFLZS_01965 [Patescibacteria group bacterium]
MGKQILFLALSMCLIPTSVLGEIPEDYATTDGHLFQAGEDSDPGWIFGQKPGQESDHCMEYIPADQLFSGVKAEGNFGEVPDEVTCWIRPSVDIIITVTLTNENLVEYSDSINIEGANVGQWNYCLFEFNPSPYPWEWVRIDLEGDVIGSGTLGVMFDLIYTEGVLWDNCDYGGLSGIESASFGGIKAAFR